MKPPFRADQVGSLLRPDALREARAKYVAGDSTLEEYRAAEDVAIKDVVAKQESIGLKSITDGEFRRDWWHLDFLVELDGVESHQPQGPSFKDSHEQPPQPVTVGKVAYKPSIMVQDSAFLKSVTKQTAKTTIPAPTMLHLRGGRASVSTEAYPDIDEFWHDVSQAYRAAIKDFADAGCEYLQLDDTSWAYLCDAGIQERCRANGDDPDKLPAIYAKALNDALIDRPEGMAITMHTCRGNFKSTFVASGGYTDAVLEAMFSVNIDGFFMEFDDDRSGSFDPLRYVRPDQQVVLGLVTSKFGELEDKDTIKRRIETATKFVPLEQLCLSPQCGFSSTHHGNDLSMDEQWHKLELIVDIANEVWTDA